MDKSVFAERLRRAAERTRDFTRTLIFESLPDAIRFDVQLNCSYDGNQLHPDERIYPEDPERIPATSGSGLTREEVVELLWREGTVPEWIDLSVSREDGEHTAIEVACCGRFTANEQLLYHEREGYPPFHVLGPPLPPSYDIENRRRYSLYWHVQVRSEAELARLRSRSLHVETLVLSGPALDDSILEALSRTSLPALRLLRLEKTRILGPGLRQFVGVPLRDLVWQAAPELPIDLRAIDGFSGLEDLEVEVQGALLKGVSTLASLPSLTSLRLHASSFTDFGTLPSLDSLVELDVAGSPVKSLETLRRFQLLSTLSLQKTAVGDENLRALAGLTRLRSLTLDKTSVSDAGLAHLLKLSTLRDLYLENTRVSDAGLKHLPVLNLRRVHLRGTQVTKEGVAWLRDQCPKLRILSAFAQYTSPRAGSGLGSGS
ncbi:hypothetical protein [Myxococcus sp. Y35]|uniref:hypothetical protein n=1 Tax=Pseudomyxococcus flavus TaxID=3115648 RepID=UPI003CE96333